MVAVPTLFALVVLYVTASTCGTSSNSERVLSYANCKRDEGLNTQCFNISYHNSTKGVCWDLAVSTSIDEWALIVGHGILPSVWKSFSPSFHQGIHSALPAHHPPCQQLLPLVKVVSVWFSSCSAFNTPSTTSELPLLLLRRVCRLYLCIKLLDLRRAPSWDWIAGLPYEHRPPTVPAPKRRRERLQLVADQVQATTDGEVANARREHRDPLAAPFQVPQQIAEAPAHS